MIRTLRAADRAAVPWKNGGGITREVAIWPPGSGFDGFDWRVSMAEVREAGPFSRFDNIDRTLMILEGRMVLTFADRWIELTSASAPFAFRGDIACEGCPIGGPVTDLNVMTRRGRATAAVRRVIDQSLSVNGPHTLIVTVTDCTVAMGEDSTSLVPRDAIHTEGPADIGIAGSAYVMEFA